jgi:hypothetical protein
MTSRTVVAFGVIHIVGFIDYRMYYQELTALTTGYRELPTYAWTTYPLMRG